MKRIIIIFLGLFSLKGHSQLTATVMIPPIGIIDKQQLWNIVLTNTDNVPLNVNINVLVTERNGGREVFSATTNMVSVPPGVKQLTTSDISAVRYNLLNPNYQIDAGPTGLLPIGSFMICYNFQPEFAKVPFQSCQPLVVQALSPLLLNLPANKSTLEEIHPNFSWLPFSLPQAAMTYLRYSFRLVEVYPNQSATDAIEKNIPLDITDLQTTNLFYSTAFPSLQDGKQYAWRVTALNRSSELARSEVWTFATAGKDSTTMNYSTPSYIRLKKQGEEGAYAVFFDHVRFEYFNETNDTAWNAKLIDITAQSKNIYLTTLDTLKLIPGENLVNLPSTTISELKDKHIYLLQVFNSRNETWQLKFEYRKEK